MTNKISKKFRVNKDIQKSIIDINNAIVKVNEVDNTITSLENSVENITEILGDDSSGFTKEINDIQDLVQTIKNNHLKLNIKDYGATGNINQDISDILQNLLNSITTDSATILFPYGTYNITKEIIMPKKSITFIGDGVDATTIINNGETIIRSFFYKGNDNTARYNYFKNIKFNGNKKVNRSIYYQKGNGTKILHCKFVNHLQAGVWFEADESASGAVIYESEIRGNYFRGVNGNVVDGEPVEEMPEYNLYMGRGATDSLIKDNILVNAKCEMYVYGGNNMIRDNHFFEYPVPAYNGEHHIIINGTCTVIGNYFDSPVCGIEANGERFFITNNTFFWGNETIDRSNFIGVKVNLITSRQRGVVITNIILNPIGSSVGYDIKVENETLETPMIMNNRTMNITNIYQPLIQYEYGTTTNSLKVNGDIRFKGGLYPIGGSRNLGDSSNYFNVSYFNYGQKVKMDNYTLTNFPESLQTGFVDIMQLIQNLSNRVKDLENK